MVRFFLQRLFAAGNWRPLGPAERELPQRVSANVRDRTTQQKSSMGPAPRPKLACIPAFGSRCRRPFVKQKPRSAPGEAWRFSQCFVFQDGSPSMPHNQYRSSLSNPPSNGRHSRSKVNRVRECSDRLPKWRTCSHTFLTSQLLASL
jgi:hypothetical protein